MAVNKRIYMLLAVGLALPLQFCTASKSAQSGSREAAPDAITYTGHIRPIMVEKCTPCHFPKEGKKKMLDTYTATKNNITEILGRIELPPEDEAFMPFKSKKPPLTDAEIELFESWVSGGMPE